MAAPGIVKRHSRECRSRAEGRCDCRAGYEAWVFSKRENRKIRKSFAREAEAKAWRADALVALSQGTLRAPKPTIVRGAWEAWYEGARAGVIRNRSGDPYKPSALRAYEGAMRREILPELGAVRLSDLQRPDLQHFADRLLARGLGASAVQTTLLPLRAIYRRAVDGGEVAIDPCAGLRLPAVRGRRERFASPSEAEALIAATPERDRAIWATAMYAGLRLGELRALRVLDVDLAAGVIHVERGWDPAEGMIELKSHAGKRKVPIAAVLRDHLVEHRTRVDRVARGLIFGDTPHSLFTANMLQRRADKAWAAAGLERLTPHACRHTFASLMIASRRQREGALDVHGHAKIGITLDRYGHLMPGSEAQAAGLLDTYLGVQRARAEEAARAAGAELTGAPTGAQSADEA